VSVLSSGYVKVGHLDLHHTFGGRGKPALVFIHGLGSSGYIEWRYNLEEFAGRHRVFAPDLPGFGRSGKPATARYGIAYFARAIDRYMEARRLREVVLVGTSMGGRVAIEIALKYRHRLAKLVLVDPLGLGRPALQPYYPVMLLPRMGETLIHGVKHAFRLAPAGLLRRFSGRYVGARGDLARTMSDEYLGQMREMYASSGYPEAYIRTIRSLVSPRAFFSGQVDVTARLGEVDMPILLIWGSRDPLFPVAQAGRAHARLPNSRLVVIEDAGHTPQAERPDEFNRALAAFVSQP
jgi:pimeloyl-ACP methyl ester carboxylesterase